ncbi:MAG TPA: S41 family peptidase [Bryobacteraceae bacterium]|jgi:hypothetical protein
MRILFALMLAGLVWAKKPPETSITPAEMAAESAWLASFGVHGDTLTGSPFTLPFSNRSFIVPTARLRLAKSELVDVNAADLRKDLRVLHQVMERAYGGWGSAESRGWDWKGWFSDWDRMLAHRGKKRIIVQEAFEPFEKLIAFQLDNHSGPVLANARFGSGSRTSLFELAPDGVCTDMTMAGGMKFTLDAKDPGQQPRRAVLRDASTGVWYIAYPEKRGEAALVKCGGKWVPVTPAWRPERKERAKNILDLAGTAEDAPSFRVMSPEISYLRLPTFSKQNGELLRKLMAGVPESAGKEKLLIVDLRGNDGGDAPLEELSRWIDEETLRRASSFTRRLAQSCVATALHWGYTQATMMPVQPPISDTLRRSLQTQVDGLAGTVADGCIGTFTEERSAWNYTLRAHKEHALPEHPRFLVLVDEACGSDCEFMTYTFATTSRAVIAGVNTFGVMQFIQPGYFMLPHSGVRFRIALGRSDPYGDDRSVDGYGLDVDLLLATAKDRSPEAILELARLLASR